VIKLNGRIEFLKKEYENNECKNFESLKLKEAIKRSN
jgi:hypothetical protein